MACFSEVAVFFSVGALAVCLQLVNNNEVIEAAKSNFEIRMIGIFNYKWDILTF